MSTTPSNVRILRLILGDQLHENHSWFTDVDPETVYLIAELRSETDYVCHHIQKVACIFAAMRSFAAMLSSKGHRVIYQRITDNDAKGTFGDLLRYYVDILRPSMVQVMQADEWRVDQHLEEVARSLPVPLEVVSSEHFLTERDELQRMFPGKKTWRMETFYRRMRQRYNVLMVGDQPYGGVWNLDSDNRQPWKGTPSVPTNYPVVNDLSDVVRDIQAAGVRTMGTVQPSNVPWPVTRLQAQSVLQWFITSCLPYFGPYQDAMTMKSEMLFHSRISFALNIKLLHPLEVIRAVETAFHHQQSNYPIPLSSAEGFIRQILGWREYVRCVYWASMPDYASMNVLQHVAKLPRWFWTGETSMACVRSAIESSLNNAYAHHIQRLMITGNIALLLGCNPSAVDAWYLGIYIDAFEWVEMPNTRGMSQFADGGAMASKPYVSSAAYIQRMSDYCTSCSYNPKKRIGDGACPFTSLYWEFHERNRDVLGRNHRLMMVYRTLDAMHPEERTALMNQARYYRENADLL
jgi:deoxyribodipyrimidine photolyase-related protein